MANWREVLEQWKIEGKSPEFEVPLTEAALNLLHFFLWSSWSLAPQVGQVVQVGRRMVKKSPTFQMWEPKWEFRKLESTWMSGREYSSGKWPHKVIYESWAHSKVAHTWIWLKSAFKFNRQTTCSRLRLANGKCTHGTGPDSTAKAWKLNWH